VSQTWRLSRHKVNNSVLRIAMMPSLNTIHRMLAALILLFVAIHLLNHTVAIAGADSHIEIMELFRVLYRNPIVEIVILFCLLLQISIGFYFVIRSKNKRHDLFSRAQLFSGLYIAFFVLFHVGAVLNGRYNLNLDTNFYFASAGMYIGQLKYFFIPYYFLAVVAVFTHVACFARWRISRNASIDRANIVAAAMVITGVLLGILIVASLAGVFYDVNIPNEYKNMF